MPFKGGGAGELGKETRFYQLDASGKLRSMTGTK